MVRVIQPSPNMRFVFLVHRLHQVFPRDVERDGCDKLAIALLFRLYAARGLRVEIKQGVGDIMLGFNDILAIANVEQELANAQWGYRRSTSITRIGSPV